MKLENIAEYTIRQAHVLCKKIITAKTKSSSNVDILIFEDMPSVAHMKAQKS